ncbi:class I SAM-dependent methyltransferase [Ferruginivarius sediminum]|nr:class I SAM-dependent methyltransferase [Ferruginivarius sediminum]
MTGAHREITPVVLTADGWADYRLLDSGAGRKLERYGPHTVIRPEPQAIWRPALDDAAWDAADASFEGTDESASRWSFKGEPPQAWEMQYRGTAFEARFTPFRHLGVFPEQATQWDWITARLEERPRPAKVLNLFAYTGVASLIAARAGAQVTHLDASKKAITWANRNQELARLEEAPIRWICDDALKFLRREVRRGNRYDGVILDPPKYGRGTKGEVWRLFEDLPELLSLCRAVLSDDPLFLVATVYAIRMSSQSLHFGLAEALADLPGTLESGEMAVRDHAGRVLSSAIFSRWMG